VLDLLQRKEDQDQDQELLEPDQDLFPVVEEEADLAVNPRLKSLLVLKTQKRYSPFDY
jgi:hypothetical protein